MSVTDRRGGLEGLRSRWWFFVPALCSFALSVAAALPHLSRSPPSITPDSALYLYVGRRMARGALPYLTTWDVKPPAIFETTALISLLVGGDSLAMHAVGLVANAVALALSCVLLALIARRFTANSVAAFAAGVVPLAYPYTDLYAARGIRAIFFLCLFGLAAVYFYLDDRVILSTASGALAAAYWHFGLVFPLAVLGAYWYRAFRYPKADRTGRYNHWLALGTLVAVTLLVCAPFVLGGALGPLVIQTVVVHLIAPERIEVLGNLRVYLSLFSLPTVLGAYGAGLVAWRYRSRLLAALSIRSARSIRSSRSLARAGNGGSAVAREVPRGLWWVPLTIGWFLCQVLALDMDGPPDFVPLTVFAGLGVACLIDAVASDRATSDPDGTADRTARDRSDRPATAGRFARRNGSHLLGLVGVAVGVSLVWVLLSDPPFLPTTGRVPQLFYSGHVAPSCHVRFTEAERLWLARTAADPGDEICLGRDLGTVLDLLRARL